MVFKRKNNVADEKEILVNNVDESSSTSNDETVETTIYFSPLMEIEQVDRYSFQFLHNQLPPLIPNQLSLELTEVKKQGFEWHVVAFIRNSVAQGVSLNEVPLQLIGPNGEKFASKVFDLSPLGQLPGNTSCPWLFVFGPNDLYSNQIPKDGCKLAFDVRHSHQLDLDETWENKLSEEDKIKLAQYVQNIQPPNAGEVNFLGINSLVDPNGFLHVTLLVRNGNEYDINLEQLPLFVDDASGEVVAMGVFNLKDFVVKANTSRPWTFIFPKDMLTKETLDLSTWRVYPPTAEQEAEKTPII